MSKQPLNSNSNVAESEEILKSIRDRCQLLGLSFAFFSKSILEIIQMYTRLTVSQNLRLTGTDNDILDPPKTVGVTLACILALEAKKQLTSFLGGYVKPPVINPPGFITNAYATNAEISDDPEGNPGTYILLPRQFVKSTIVNSEIIKKCGNDLIIYIIRNKDVIGFANICFTFFSNDACEIEKGIFWNFFGVKNPTLGPQVERVTGTQILKLLEDMFRLLRFNRQCVPPDVPIPGYETIFDTKKIDKIAGCAAGQAALSFWINNGYKELGKEEAKNAGWTDEEMNDPKIFPVEKRLETIAAAEVVVASSRAVVVAEEKSEAAVTASSRAVEEEETVFSAAETNRMIEKRNTQFIPSQSNSSSEPDRLTQFPYRYRFRGPVKSCVSLSAAKTFDFNPNLALREKTLEDFYGMGLFSTEVTRDWYNRNKRNKEIPIDDRPILPFDAQKTDDDSYGDGVDAQKTDDDDDDVDDDKEEDEYGEEQPQGYIWGDDTEQPNTNKRRAKGDTRNEIKRHRATGPSQKSGGGVGGKRRPRRQRQKTKRNNKQTKQTKRRKQKTNNGVNKRQTKRAKKRQTKKV